MVTTNLFRCCVWLLVICLEWVAILGLWATATAQTPEPPVWNIPNSAPANTRGTAQSYVFFGGRGGTESAAPVDICASIFTSDSNVRVWAIIPAMPIITEMSSHRTPVLALNSFIGGAKLQPFVTIELCNGDIDPVPQVRLQGPNGFSVTLEPVSIDKGEIVELNSETSPEDKSISYGLAYLLLENSELGQYELMINDQGWKFTYPLEVVYKDARNPIDFVGENILFRLKESKTKAITSTFASNTSMVVEVFGTHNGEQLLFELFRSNRSLGTQARSVIIGEDEITPDYVLVAETVMTATVNDLTKSFSFEIDLSQLGGGDYVLIGSQSAVNNKAQGYFYAGENFVMQTVSINGVSADIFISSQYFTIESEEPVFQSLSQFSSGSSLYLDTAIGYEGLKLLNPNGSPNGNIPVTTKPMVFLDASTCVKPNKNHPEWSYVYVQTPDGRKGCVLQRYLLPVPTIEAYYNFSQCFLDELGIRLVTWLQSGCDDNAKTLSHIEFESLMRTIGDEGQLLPMILINETLAPGSLNGNTLRLEIHNENGNQVGWLNFGWKVPHNKRESPVGAVWRTDMNGQFKEPTCWLRRDGVWRCETVNEITPWIK